jgi:hypothetical protein
VTVRYADGAMQTDETMDALAYRPASLVVAASDERAGCR